MKILNKKLRMLAFSLQKKVLNVQLHNKVKMVEICFKNQFTQTGTLKCICTDEWLTNSQDIIFALMIRNKSRTINLKREESFHGKKKNIKKYIEEAQQLTAQGNYYYNVDKCGVGFHGDAERKKVIALRLCNGKCPPLHYQWFYKGKPTGKRAIIELEDKDIYIMSEKAVGNDWKKKNTATLRHATGCQKFLKI